MINLDRYPNGKQFALTMSYDDGVVQDRRLVALFNKYNIKGTFHLNGNLFDTARCISAAEVNKLYDGHEVSCHTLTHPRLDRMSSEGVINQILGDRLCLEELSGNIVNGLSYPFGIYDKKTKDALAACGIVYARTVEPTHNFFLPKDFLEWHPTCHHKEALKYGEKFIDSFPFPNRTDNIFYCWGHSYEFDNDNNWNLIEEFCEMMGNRKEIWYATNIEIYNYVKARENLVFSASGNIVYNPSATDIWFSDEKEAPHCVKAGQMLALNS